MAVLILKKYKVKITDKSCKYRGWDFLIKLQNIKKNIE